MRLGFFSGMCSCNTKTWNWIVFLNIKFILFETVGILKPDIQRCSPSSPLLLDVFTITAVQVSPKRWLREKRRKSRQIIPWTHCQNGTIYSDQENIFLFTKKLHASEIRQTDDTLRRGHIVLNCRRVIWIITTGQQYKWQCTSPWRWL